jgi:hypothetical protein
MSVYLSEATDRHAEQILADHSDDGDGWCEFHLRHFSIRVRYGECDAFLRAHRVRSAYQQQRTRRPVHTRSTASSRPPDRPPQDSASGPGAVVWRTPEGL